MRPDDPFVEKEKVRFIKILRSAGVSALSSKTSARVARVGGTIRPRSDRRLFFFIRIVFKTQRRFPIMKTKRNRCCSGPETAVGYQTWLFKIERGKMRELAGTVQKSLPASRLEKKGFINNQN